MTATGQGKWRVDVQNFNVKKPGPSGELTEPVSYSESFDSFERALEYAREQRLMHHYRVVLIEGPNGVSMDEDEIAQQCEALRSME